MGDYTEDEYWQEMNRQRPEDLQETKEEKKAKMREFLRAIFFIPDREKKKSKIDEMG